MTAFAIAALMMLSGWLAIRLSSANSENADLKNRIESLKRQLRVR